MCWKFNSVWNGTLNCVFLKKINLGGRETTGCSLHRPSNLWQYPCFCFLSVGIADMRSHACLIHEMKTAQFLTHSPRYYFVSLPWECILRSTRVHTSVIWVVLQYTLFCNLDFPLGSFYIVTSKTLHYIDRCIIYISISLWLGSWCF